MLVGVSSVLSKASDTFPTLKTLNSVFYLQVKTFHCTKNPLTFPLKSYCNIFTYLGILCRRWEEKCYPHPGIHCGSNVYTNNFEITFIRTSFIGTVSAVCAFVFLQFKDWFTPSENEQECENYLRYCSLLSQMFPLSHQLAMRSHSLSVNELQWRHGVKNLWKWPALAYFTAASHSLTFFLLP